jgi:hypothetical protein
MAIKRLCQAVLLSLCLFGNANVIASENPLGQTFQINTHLDSYVGKPSWLLIITDVQTGQVMPYLFDITSNDNFWVQFTFAHTYRVSASELHFGPPDDIIRNFCHLQGGILDHESLVINLSGRLTPKRNTAQCTVSHYKEYSFPIAPPEEEQSEAEPEEAASPLASLLPGKTTNPAPPSLASLAPTLAQLAPLAKLAK